MLLTEMIPTSSSWNNARSKLPKKRWDILRINCYQKAGGKCEICGETGKEQGFKHDLEAHEVWSYNLKTKIQKLVRLIALCPLCHRTKHIGRSTRMGWQAICLKHMMKINKWSPRQVFNHLAEAYRIQKERSVIKFKLDISIVLINKRFTQI